MSPDGRGAEESDQASEQVDPAVLTHKVRTCGVS